MTNNVYFGLVIGLAKKLEGMVASVDEREVALTGAKLIAIEIALQ